MTAWLSVLVSVAALSIGLAPDDEPVPGGSVAGDIEIAKALDDFHHRWSLATQPTSAARWQPVTVGAHDGIDALKSGKINGNEQTTFSTIVKGPLKVTFWWKVESEKNNDELVFQVDGMDRLPISGNQDWAKVEQEISAGEHTLSWTYRKDGSRDNGSDAGWIDGIEMTDVKEARVEIIEPKDGVTTHTIAAPAIPDRRYQLWLKEKGQDWKVGANEAKLSKGNRIEFPESKYKVGQREYRIILVEPPTITALPTNLDAVEGKPFSMDVKTDPGKTPVGSLEPLKFRWYFLPAGAAVEKPFVLMPDQKGSALMLLKVTLESAGRYYMEISNSAGTETSPMFDLKVHIPPRNAQITASPALKSWVLGGEGRLTAKAEGELPLAFHWFHGKEEMKDEATNELSIPRIEQKHAGEYYVVVTHQKWGKAASGKVEVTLIRPPVPGEGPRSISAYQGDVVSLGITATGAPPITYRWYRNGELIKGTDGAVLSLDTTTVDTFIYRVQVSNPTKIAAINGEIRLEVRPLVAQRIEDLKLDLAPIPAGNFRMGSRQGGENNERPVRDILISRGYWLGTTEITRAQWNVLFPATGKLEGDDAKRPQIASHDAAVRFCKELTRREREANRLEPTMEYALPTEAEWEYAARLGRGADDLTNRAWFHDPANPSSLHPVGGKQADALGLHDMFGNVWEWTADFLGDYDARIVADPQGPPTGDYRVLRGGSIKMGASGLGPGVRYSDKPDQGRDDYGFRIVKRRVGRLPQPFQLNEAEDRPAPKGAPK